MNKLLSEQKVKEILEIDDFRHLTKDKVIILASMIDQMEPEVAKAALEQFPEFSKTVKHLIEDYLVRLEKLGDINKESIKSYFEIAKIQMEAYKELLLKEDLMFEERKYIMEQMAELDNKLAEKDTETKKMTIMMNAVAATVTTAGIIALTVGIGGKVKIPLDKVGKVAGRVAKSVA